MNLFPILAGAISLASIVPLSFAITTEIHPRHASTSTIMGHQIHVQDDGSVSGRVKEPACRGTWKVVWTCLATTFLCVWTLLCLATLVFMGLHLAAWDFEFPSRAEQILWRVSSLVLFLVTAAFWVAETAASWVRLGRWRRLYLLMVNPEKLAILDLQSSREDEKAAPAPRKAIELPLAWEFWTIAPIAFLYGVARLYQVLEGFLQLRHVDATVFVHVPWSMYFPHV